jgi:hypothetical protein
MSLAPLYQHVCLLYSMEMDVQSYYRTWSLWIMRALQLQLYVTYATWPLLLWWGLPISLLSPLGNIIFAPLLIAFLFLSSSLFICYLCSIPHTLLISALELLSNLWLSLTSWCSFPSLLITFATPPWWLLIFFPAIALMLIIHPTLRNPLRSIFAFIIAFFLTSCLLTLYTPTSIPSLTKSMHITRHDRKTMIVIDSQTHRRLPTFSWIRYQLPPLLITATGSSTIHTLVVTKMTPAVHALVHHICSYLSVETLVVPPSSFDSTTYAVKKHMIVSTKTPLALNDTVTLEPEVIKKHTILRLIYRDITQ